MDHRSNIWHLFIICITIFGVCHPGNGTPPLTADSAVARLQAEQTAYEEKHDIAPLRQKVRSLTVATTRAQQRFDRAMQSKAKKGARAIASKLSNSIQSNTEHLAQLKIALDQKKAELAESQAQLRLLLDHSPVKRRYASPTQKQVAAAGTIQRGILAARERYNLYMLAHRQAMSAPEFDQINVLKAKKAELEAALERMKQPGVPALHEQRLIHEALQELPIIDTKLNRLTTREANIDRLREKRVARINNAHERYKAQALQARGINYTPQFIEEPAPLSEDKQALLPPVSAKKMTPSPAPVATPAPLPPARIAPSVPRPAPTPAPTWHRTAGIIGLSSLGLVTGLAAIIFITAYNARGLQDHELDVLPASKRGIIKIARRMGMFRFNKDLLIH